jgi:hypothetical protein
MNETHDSLEEELSSLQPHGPSSELRRRIAERLAEPVPGSRWRSWKSSLALSAAAACLAVFCWPWIAGHDGNKNPKHVAIHANAAAATGVLKPTLLAYQRAWNRSPEELEVLLNRQAIVTPDRDPELVRIGAFTRSDAALHALLGDD